MYLYLPGIVSSGGPTTSSHVESYNGITDFLSKTSLLKLFGGTLLRITILQLVTGNGA